LNLNTGQMVAVKRIRLEGLKEEEVTQLMREVDLVKSLSHPSIVKYEGMARDKDTLSIVLECVPCSVALARNDTHVILQVCGEWFPGSDPEVFW
jgi:serine/threonine protein kinase